MSPRREAKTGPARVRAALALAGLVLVASCQREDREHTRELLHEAGRRAEQGLVVAKHELDQAKRGLDSARERYELDQKVAAARQQFERGVEEAADAFSELAETSREPGGARSEYKPIPGAAEAIRCEGERCHMQASFIDRLAANPAQLTREAMLVPSPASTGAGLRVRRVRAGSVPDLLGLRDGDVLVEVNGAALGSFEAIRELDEVLQGRDQAVLVYERAGERRSLTILRDPPGKTPTGG